MKKGLAIIIWSAMILANSVFASGEVTTGNSAAPVVTTPQTDAQKLAVVACIKAAALTREWYLQSAYRTFTDAIMVGYQRRSEAISAAYDTKSIKDAKPLIRTAFDTWKEVVKKAREAFNKNRKDIWATFKKDVWLCRPDRKTWQDATQDASWQERSEGSIL